VSYYKKPILQKRMLKLNEKDFFIKLNYKPQDLNDTLNNAITALVNEYEEDFPAKQSELVRRAFAQIRKYRHLINGSDTTDVEGRTKELCIYDQYCSLCGMLGSVRVQLQKEKSPQNKRLEDCLTEMLLASNIDLVEDKALDKCIIRYELKFSIMSRPEHFIYEREEYSAAFVSLANSLQRIQLYLPHSHLEKCLQQAQLMMQCLQKEENKSSFDIGFATNLLNTTKELLEKPNDQRLQKKYKKLAQAAEGHPGILRKIGGYALALLGAVIVAASVLVTITLATPLAIVGFYAGTCLMSVGLFATRRRGLAKYISGFGGATKKAEAKLSSLSEVYGCAPMAAHGPIC